MTVVPGDHVEFSELPGRRSGDPLQELAAASSVRIVRLARTPRRLAHRHPASEEIIYVREGRGVVFVDGVKNSVTAGDTVYIPPGVAHATIPDADTEMELVCFFPHPYLAGNLEDTDIDVMRV